MGPHQLSCRQRHHPADHRLADRTSRTPQLFPAVDRDLHAELRAVRNGRQPRSIDPVPRDPGAGGRWPPALQPGRAARRVPAGKAGRRDDAVRLRRPDRAHRRADPGRLDHRLVFVAMGFPDQCARRSPCTRRLLGNAARPGLSDGAARGTEAAAISIRHDRSVPARHRYRLLGSDAQQGTGVGLAGRPALARTDIGGALCGGPRRACRLGAAASQPRGQLSDRCASAISPGAASSSFALMPRSTPPAPRCRGCSSRCSATMP